ncbi:hypothetical protein [Enterobacter hormaechei]|uniref:hypothetical protein n=1 Tax=Enterobacter hormaechei TaxID=158836 RepID=UPI0020174A66|nr:hypothetical protein [Enterobacter hormaechei]
MYYREAPTGIIVLAVLHEKQDPQNYRGEGTRPPSILANPTIRQRHLFCGLNHQRTQLGDAVVGHT